MNIGCNSNPVGYTNMSHCHVVCTTVAFTLAFVHWPIYITWCSHVRIDCMIVTTVDMWWAIWRILQV